MVQGVIEVGAKDFDPLGAVKATSYSSIRTTTHETSTSQCDNSLSYTMLGLLSMITVGGHAARSSLPILEIYFLSDNFVSSVGYGTILSVQLIPVMIVPFFIGHLYDHIDHKIVTITLLLISLFGQIVFAIAVGISCYYLAIIAQIISGAGFSSLVVAQHALIAANFQESIALGIGITTAVSGLCKLISKATMAPLVDVCDSYKLPLFVICVYSLFSLIAGVLFVSHHSANRLTRRMQAPEISFYRIFTACKAFTPCYWGLVLINMCYMMMFHTLFNYLPHILVDSLRITMVDAGYLCSAIHLFPIFISPLIGLLPAWRKWATHICLVAGIMAIVAYVRLCRQANSPQFTILLLSFAEALIPTITVSLIPSTIPANVCGVGFGVLSIADNAAVFCGNLFFGYLYDSTHTFTIGVFILCCLSVLNFVLVCVYVVNSP